MVHHFDPGCITYKMYVFIELCKEVLHAKYLISKHSRFTKVPIIVYINKGQDVKWLHTVFKREKIVANLTEWLPRLEYLQHWHDY
jgi:hypothetical protein